MTMAVPMSWPTTMMPTAAWRPIDDTFPIDFSSPLVSISTTNLPLLNWSIQDRAAPSSDGTLRASSDPDRRALKLLLDLVRRERLHQRGPCLGHRRFSEVDVERQGTRGLLGLD